MTSREVDAAIARSLPATWDVFFGQHGTLLAGQVAVIPGILRGLDTLLMSPTASGKTEAACAPLVERNLGRPRPSVLYVSPTRALTNDIFRRLETPLGVLGLQLARRTGEYRPARGAEPDVLLTTPESLDSMICRGGRDDVGHLLQSVQAVVLDEIHLLHGSARGEQIRWLLERLRRLQQYERAQGRIADSRLQVVALSATVPCPDKVCQDYLSADAQVIQLGGQRELVCIAPPSPCLPSIEHALPALLGAVEGDCKVLAFANARRRVDDLSFKLQRELDALEFDVVAHHGSLSRPERERAEKRMGEPGRVVLVATSTLEIGIDIGDVDLVALDGPAPSISSFLQRVGRGNRRSHQTRVLACSGSLTEASLQTAMLHCAMKGDLGPDDSGLELAVARQQIASWIFQSPTGRRTMSQLTEFASHGIGDRQAGALIDHLVTKGELLRQEGYLQLGAPWLDRSATGGIHSNIESTFGQTVTDAETGKAIAVGVQMTKQAGQVRIAGNLLDVRSWGERRIEVARATAEGRGASWGYISRGFPTGSSQTYALRQYLGLAEAEWPTLVEDGRIHAFHLGGPAFQAFLSLALAIVGPDGKWRADPYTLSGQAMQDACRKSLIGVTRSHIETVLADKLPDVERRLGRPGANKHLPISIRLEEVRSWLKLGSAIESLHASRWVVVDDPGLRSILLGLLGEEKRGLKENRQKSDT